MMGNNIEKIRDALAGAVLGAVASVIIFIVSIIISAVRFVGGLGSGNSSFEPMQGSTLVTMVVCLMILGAVLGFAYGSYATQEDAVKKRIQKWLLKHNKI